MGTAIEHQSELPNPAHAEPLRSLRKAAYLTAAMGVAARDALSPLVLADLGCARAESIQPGDHLLLRQRPESPPDPGRSVRHAIRGDRLHLVHRRAANVDQRSGPTRKRAACRTFSSSRASSISRLFFGGAAASSALAASVQFAQGTVDPDTARQFPQFGSALVLVFGMRMAAMFVFSTTNITRGVGIIPKWFAIIGLVVGLGSC